VYKEAEREKRSMKVDVGGRMFEEKRGGWKG